MNRKHAIDESTRWSSCWHKWWLRWRRLTIMMTFIRFEEYWSASKSQSLFHVNSTTYFFDIVVEVSRDSDLKLRNGFYMCIRRDVARARLSTGSERLFFMFRAVKWEFFYCFARIKSLDLKRYLMAFGSCSWWMAYQTNACRRFHDIKTSENCDDWQFKKWRRSHLLTSLTNQSVFASGKSLFSHSPKCRNKKANKFVTRLSVRSFLLLDVTRRDKQEHLYSWAALLATECRTRIAKLVLCHHSPE